MGAGETREARRYRARMLALQHEKQLRGNNIYFEGGEWFKRCPVCQQTFYSPAKQRRYCSDECRRSAEERAEAVDRWMQNLALARCAAPSCESQFRPRRRDHRFCSDACRYAFRNSFRNLNSSRPCVRCGKPFEAHRSTARYCSGACRVQAHYARKKKRVPGY